ncbi:MAG: outer membrane protein [Geminicoccaceae bacterium]
MIKKAAFVCLGTVCLQPTVWAHDVPPAETQSVAHGEQEPEQRSKLASAFDGFYVGATIGPVFYRDNSIDDVDLDYEAGRQLSVFVGTRLSRLRIEAEFVNQGVEFDPSTSRFDGDLYIFRAVAGVYLDIARFKVGGLDDVTPYLGGGFGVADADIEGFDDDVGFTYHGGIGVSFPVNANFDIVAGYRYERTDFSEFDDDQEAHTIRAGARYNF